MAQQRFTAVFREALRNAHGDKSCMKKPEEEKALKQRFGLPSRLTYLEMKTLLHHVSLVALFLRHQLFCSAGKLRLVPLFLFGRGQNPLALPRHLHN